MSKYQRYAFLAADRPLTEKQRAELRSLPTRGGDGAASRRVRAWRLAEMRRRLGITQAEVAARIGVTQGRVSAIEHAKPGAAELRTPAA
jgi:DNA-binding transcriptional regulator YiaG